MNVRLEFNGKNVHLILGDVFRLTEHLNASGPVVEWQRVLTAMRDNEVQGITVGTDDTIAITPKGLSDEEEAAAAEFYGWEVEA
jgi:hypothetical protein